jgi:hypothetical protein
MIWMSLLILLLCIGPFTVFVTGGARLRGDWRLASHDPTGLAPEPLQTPQAVVQVYAARAFAWRGAFSVHTWIAVKSAHAKRYTRYEVIGWRYYRGLSAVSVSDERAPDAQWFGANPWLLRDIRGADAEAIIAALPDAVTSYPYPRYYRPWPGPNSNTFIAHIGRQMPQLCLALPAIAVGKDYLGKGEWIARTPSGTGVQLSVSGMFGVLVGWREGIELNLAALNVGIDPRGLAIQLPGIGRIGRSVSP